MQAADLITQKAIIDFGAQNPKRLRAILEKSLCQDHLADFCRTFWPVLEPVVKLKWGWALDAMCEHLEAVSNDQIDNLKMNVPPGMMKPICSEVLVLTLDGFKRHGDLKSGDYVYGPDGLLKRVIATSEERLEPSCEISFDDGTSVIAGIGHDWSIERDRQDATTNHKRVRVPAIVRSDDLKTGPRGDRVAIARPIKRGRAHDLLIDPYLLGLWLGDGASNTGVIYATEKDLSLIHI